MRSAIHILSERGDLKGSNKERTEQTPPTEESTIDDTVNTQRTSRTKQRRKHAATTAAATAMYVALAAQESTCRFWAKSEKEAWRNAGGSRSKTSTRARKKPTWIAVRALAENSNSGSEEGGCDAAAGDALCVGCSGLSR
jgi:hypothetical protein